jgi:hypothetical protein
MAAHLERSVADRADAHAPEADHRVPDGVAHIAHLPRLPLVNRHGYQRLVGACAQAALDHAHHRGRRTLTLDPHAAAHPIQAFLGRFAAYAREVFPFHLVAGMQQAFGERPVVGEEQQAFRVVVESSHGVDVLGDLGEQIEHGRPALRVLPRRDVAPGFVEQDVAVARGDPDPRAVDADVVAAGLGPRAEFQYGRAVHRHAPLGDQRLRRAPRGYPGG